MVMLLHPRHFLDRVHSDLNNMLFVQYVDRASRYNMWSSVKALLSHSISALPAVVMVSVNADTVCTQKKRVWNCTVQDTATVLNESILNALQGADGALP